MSLTQPVMWWVLVGVLLAAEMLVGTFHLVMLALGAAAGALAAHLGLAFTTQLAVAAVVGIAAVALWQWRRGPSNARPPAALNRDVNLDIGERVFVDDWAADGLARVTYRGAAWRARWAGSGAPHPGAHRVHGVEGSELLLVRDDAAAAAPTA